MRETQVPRNVHVGLGPARVPDPKRGTSHGLSLLEHLGGVFQSGHVIQELGAVVCLQRVQTFHREDNQLVSGQVIPVLIQVVNQAITIKIHPNAQGLRQCVLTVDGDNIVVAIEVSVETGQSKPESVITESREIPCDRIGCWQLVIVSGTHR